MGKCTKAGRGLTAQWATAHNTWLPRHQEDVAELLRRTAADDIFHLRVSSADPRLVAEKEFCSSYAKHQLDLIDLTDDGVHAYAWDAENP